MASIVTSDAPGTCFNPEHIKSDQWRDDMREWPSVTYGDIYNYLVISRAVDGCQMKNYKSMDSYNYFQSGAVGKIMHFVDEHGTFLKSDVRPSQRVNQDHHSPWVLCGGDGEVHTGGCTCVAGRSKTCSHVGALLWKIEFAVRMNMTGKSVTDEQTLWNRGTCRNLEPRSIDTIEFKRPKLSFDETDIDPPHGNDRSDFRISSSDTEVKDYVQNSNMKELFLLQNTIVNKTISASQSVLPGASVDSCHGLHTDEDSCGKCSDFYNKFVKLSLNQIEDLSSATTMQAGCDVWKDSRKIRITGSTASKVPVRSTTDPDKFIREHIYPTFTGNAFTQHGVTGEKKAKETLREHGHNIRDCGTVVSDKYQWLSASPDGIIQSSSGEKLLEIKCPILNDNYHSLTELFASRKYDVVRENDLNYLKVKGARGYYLQIQLTLYVTGLQHCELVIWTPEEFCIVDVKYDHSFCANTIERLQQFYFTKLLPRIVDESEAGRFSLSAAYRVLSQ